MKPNNNQTTLTSFICFLGFAAIILISPPAFGLSCKENDLSFDSTTLLLEIKNNNSYLESSKNLIYWKNSLIQNLLLSLY
jgi:hypothetical protein